jgi:hypothetical protein
MQLKPIITQLVKKKEIPCIILNLFLVKHFFYKLWSTKFNYYIMKLYIARLTNKRNYCIYITLIMHYGEKIN